MAMQTKTGLTDEALVGRSIEVSEIDALPFGICALSAAYHITSFNGLFAGSLKFTSDCLELGVSFPGFVSQLMENGTLPTHVGQSLLKLLLQCQATQRNQKGHLQFHGRAGSLVHCNMLPGGGYVFVVTDLSGPESYHKNIEIQADRLSEALLNLPHGVSMFGPDECLIICNDQYINLYALDSQIVRPGVKYIEVLAHSIARGNQRGMSLDEYYAKRLLENRSQEVAIAHLTLWNDRIIRITNRPMQNGGWVSLHEDVSEQLEANRKIVHLAHHDALTNLPNRLGFHAKFSDALAAAKNRGLPSAVLYLDLDRFKQANDSFGHVVGDKLLVNVADRLRSAVRMDDLVVRLGGDEFLILQNYASNEMAENLARRLITSMKDPFLIDGERVEIGLSIGIAIAPRDGDNSDVLLRRADQALYQAKDRGRGGYAFFGDNLEGGSPAEHLY
jgi:diguanylate cyclase (GGDEF)-like protein